VEHLPGTHVYLRDYAAHVTSRKPDLYTVGEVWDSIGAIMPYYPDQLTSHFMFELSDAILESVKNGNTAKLYPGFLRLQDALPPHRWSPFLRNHDQSRTMTVLEGNEGRAKMASALLLTLPGTPFLYYGEEIGIAGDKPDENLRTPMHWNGRAGAGFTAGTPWRAPQANFAARNVEAQDADRNSLLNLHRRLIHLRAQNPALGMGKLIPLTTSNPAVAAFLRRDEASGSTVLVIANLGTAPARNVTVSSDANVLPAGNAAPISIFGARRAARFAVGADGRIASYVPYSMLAPMELQIIDLPARR
jgi:glycosidase